MCADSGRMHADSVQEVRRQRSGSAQTTFRKCADNVQERDSEGQAEDVRLRAGGLTAIERLRAERMCADSVQDMSRQRSGSAQTTFTKETERDRLTT